MPTSLTTARLAGFDPEAPRAWRRPCEPLASADELFDWLRVASARAAAGAVSGRVRLYSAGRPVRPLPRGLLPAPEDASLTAWLDRAEAQHDDVALVVNGAQALDGALFRRLAPLAHELAAPSTGGLSVEVFVGRYRRGPFGLHKDDQDVITAVLSGRKRFLVWPFELLAERFEVEPRERSAVRVLDGVDATNLPAELRASATVVEGEAGDILYWPASAWHLAEASEPPLRAPAVTLGIGRFRAMDPGALVGKVLAAAREGAATPPLALPLGGDLTREGAVLWDTIVRWLGSAPSRARALEELVRWSSALRFPIAPPRAAAPPPVPAAVALVAPGALAWIRDGDSLVWAAGGHLARYPFHPGLERLFRRLHGGARVTVADAEALLRGEHERPVDPAVAAHVLGVLLAANAAEPRPEAGGPGAG